jgi:hypothetical protein
MIKFARTRHVYDSYSDFWKLIELSGFDTCFIDEIDISAENTTYIFSPTNGELRPHIQNQKNANKPWNAKIIWWNLERPSSITNVVIDDIIGYINETWVSDRYYASLNSNFKFVILGSHPDLRLHKENLHKIYDYCHMSYVYGRRDYIHHTLAQHGLKMGPNGWGEERDKTLRTSKMLINVHQDPFLISEPLRFAVTAAYALPIISETINDPYPLVLEQDIVIADYHNLTQKAIAIHNTDLTHLGNALYDNLCIRNTFRASVEKGLGL